MPDARGLETTAANEAAVHNPNETLARYLRFELDTGDRPERTLWRPPCWMPADLRPPPRTKRRSAT